MAKWLSAKSERRWNRSAAIVEAANAGNRFVKGIYRPPKSGTAEICTELGLEPGSYPAEAGASIASGATGSVVYDGTVYQAVNQSQCNVVIGDLVGLHVSPTCEIFFVPCVCDCSQTTPTTCCDKIIAICIDGEIKLVAVDGGSATWTLTDCCDCATPPATFGITMSCVTTTVTASWTYTCGEDVETGTLDYSGLCADPVEEPVDTISAGGCLIVISASTDAEQCEPCAAPSPEPDPQPTDCCETPVPGRLTFTMDGSTYAMDYDGADWVYNGPINGCATNVIFKVSCDGVNFTFVAANQGDNCTFSVNTQTFNSCDPFSLDVTFTVTGGGTCPCVGAKSATVTE